MFKRIIFSIKDNDETKDSRQLDFCWNHVHNKGSDTINFPEYLKKHLDTLS